MFEMAKNSVQLFFKGQLFADPAMVYRQLAIGIGVTVLILLVLYKAVGAPLWLAAIMAGFIGGAIQPYLFRDLKYR